MPELPEVDAFKRYLNATSLQQEIRKVVVEHSMVVDGVSIPRFTSVLVGCCFVSSTRYGKNLLVQLDCQPWLRFHFGMTGYLKYFKDRQDAPVYTRVLFSFTNGFHLAFACQRMLGRVSLVGSVANFVRERGLGPDAIELGLQQFRQIMNGRRGILKTTLMNQNVIAGLGNMYVDEILFQARLFPMRKVIHLSEKELYTLHSTMRKVLHTAIKHRADASKFPRSYLIHHRHEGERCPQCGGHIVRRKLSQRSTYFCPACQR